MKVSIVVPCFNKVKYIERTLLSILDQKYSDLELIVVDGNSTDGTKGVLAKYKSSIDHLIIEDDSGQSNALNKGFRLATGDVFAWMNADDVYVNDAIAKCVEIFRSMPSIKIVYGDWFSINSEDVVIDADYCFPPSRMQTIYEGVSLNAQSMFWRSDVHLRFGEFREDLHYIMDYDFVYRLILGVKRKEFYQIKTSLAAFRRYDDQKTGSGSGCQQLKEHLRLTEFYNFKHKYSFIGKFYRFLFRLRRFYYYIERGAYDKLLKKLQS